MLSNVRRRCETLFEVLTVSREEKTPLVLSLVCILVCSSCLSWCCVCRLVLPLVSCLDMSFLSPRVICRAVSGIVSHIFVSLVLCCISPLLVPSLASCCRVLAVCFVMLFISFCPFSRVVLCLASSLYGPVVESRS